MPITPTPFGGSGGAEDSPDYVTSTSPAAGSEGVAEEIDKLGDIDEGIENRVVLDETAAATVVSADTLGTANNPVTTATAARPQGLAVVYWYCATQPTNWVAGDVWDSTAATTSTNASGDLTGTYPGPTVSKIQGTTISSPSGTTTTFLNGQGGWTAPTLASGSYASADKVVYVSQASGASDSNNGLSPGAPFLTLDHAVSVLSAGGTIHLGAGTWAPTAGLTPASDTVICGSGPEVTTLSQSAASVLIHLNAVQRVTFRDIGFELLSAATTGTLLSFDGCFQCNLDNVIVRGQNTTSAATYHSQTGILFTNNAGDNNVTNFTVANLGIGVNVGSETNFFVNGTFSYNYRAVVGGDPTGVAFGAGASFQSCTWNGSNTVCDHHVYIDGSAGAWTFDNVWFESVATGIEVGSGANGPAMFSLTNCINLASTTNCLKINACAVTVLSGVSFGEDPSSTPTELVINATNATTGTAMGLRSAQAYDPFFSAVPQYWTYLGKGAVQIGGGFAATVGSNGGFKPGNGTSMGCTLWSGTGAPTISAAAGDRWFRTDTPTTSGQREYICTGGTSWTALTV